MDRAQILSSHLRERYQIIDECGAGAMGTIYKAHDIKLDRVVALKVLNMKSRSDEYRSRFFKEANILAKLSHPRIVAIHDIQEYEDDPVIIMEFFEGITMDNYLKLSNGTINLDAFLDMMIQTCEGLEYIHSKDIIHRDIKASNIMRNNDGDIKIMDFGIAKNNQLKTSSTQKFVLGTDNYMSPEQFCNLAPIDCRADIYSFGIFAYKMLTRKFPFTREENQKRRYLYGNIADLAHDETAKMQLLHSCNIMPLSILASRPEIPQELEKIIFHCIALIPAERFQTVTEIGSALITLQKTRLLSRIQNVINHGNEYLSNEEFLLSIKHFKQILSVTEKQRIDDLLQRAWNIGKNGDFEKAGVYFQEILKIDDTQKNTIKAMWKIIRLYVKGKKYIQIQEYATAIEILNQIFTIDPDNQDAKILIEDANKQWQSLTTAVLHSDSALSDQNILLPVNQISEQTDFFPMRLLKRLYKKQTLSCSSRIIGAKNRAELCNISEKEQLCLLTNSVELRRKIGHVLYKFIGSLSKDPNAWYFDKSDVYTEDANRLMVGIKHVNLSILQQKVTPPPTIASFFVSCQNLFIAHVGNYGIYQLRNGKLNTFSREDNRTLGLNQTIAVDIITVAPQQNDIYVCCSERLIPYISERKIQELLTQRTNEIHKIFYEIKSLANFESIIILEWFNNPSAQ